MKGKNDEVLENIRKFLVGTKVLSDIEFDCYMALISGGKMNAHEVFKYTKEKNIGHGSRTLISDIMKGLVGKNFAKQEDIKLTPQRSEHLFSPVKLEDALSPTIDFVNNKMHEKFDESFEFLQERNVRDDFMLHNNQQKTIKKIFDDLKSSKEYVLICSGDCTWIENEESKSIIKNLSKRKIKVKLFVSKRTDKQIIDWLKAKKIDFTFNEIYPLLCIIDGRLMYIGYNDNNGLYHALLVPEKTLIKDFEKMLTQNNNGD